ncbi:RHS repeat-associated core domain-containing protein [Pseudoxanthomonas putridarboris]|uniref:RHS repeat-associated core domain-containing protein n=1 Tax=Pseudoxanthomonas putridarboris TaxID=752605 RepID=A0ABU9J1E8_9GAMM
MGGVSRFGQQPWIGWALAWLLLWGVMGTARAQVVVEYIHTDALGSLVAVTNQAGEVIERYDYEPYGAMIGRPAYQGIGYTGHVQDAATGLTYMQQRYYDPICGCFLSVDPVTAYDDPVNYFHRYRYAGNNPYKFTDPDGRCWIFCDFLPAPRSDRTNPYAPIPGADRGDALVVGGLAATATLGVSAALAVPAATVVLANPAAVVTAGETIAGAAGVTGPAGGAKNAVAGKITGYTRHGLNQAISRDGGKGVSPKAILDAVRNPSKVVEQSEGKTAYTGQNARVVLNSEGKVITTHAKGSEGVRVKEPKK